MLSGLHQLEQSTTLEEPVEKVNARFSKYLEGLRDQFPESFPPLRKCIRIERELGDVHVRSAVHQALLSVYGPGEDPRVQEAKERATQEALEKQRGLLQQRDVRFLFGIYVTLQNLAQKNKMVHLVREDPDVGLEVNLQMINRIRQLTAAVSHTEWPQLITKEEVKEVRYDPFNVHLILPREAYARVAEGASRGKHFTGTHVNLISEGEHTERIIKHERVHNMLDGFRSGVLVGAYPERLGTRPEEVQSPVASEADDPGATRHITKVLRDARAPDLLNYLHEELLAAMEEAEEAGFVGRLRKAPLREGAEPLPSFQGHSFATAARDFHELLTFLEAQASQTRFEDFAEACVKLRNDLEAEWETLVSTIRSSLERAKAISGEAHLAVHSLFYLLKPSQYRVVPKYLDRKYGKEKKGQEKKEPQIT